MDRATLVTGFLCAATVVAYADELGLLAKSVWRRWSARGRTDLPAGVLDLAAKELESDEPERVERGLTIFRLQKGSPTTDRLVPLLNHRNPEVARRAAQLLYERQDPTALEALYWYHAKRPLV